MMRKRALANTLADRSWGSATGPPGGNGGGERDRTDDPLLAKQVLSQLSYTPVCAVVGLAGFEPATPALSRRCSNQLSYRPSCVELADSR